MFLVHHPSPQMRAPRSFLYRKYFANNTLSHAHPPSLVSDSVSHPQPTALYTNTAFVDVRVFLTQSSLLSTQYSTRADARAVPTRGPSSFRR